MTRRTGAWLADHLARSKASAYADQKVEQAIPVLTEVAPPGKYRNVQTGAYASKREARRAAELKLMEQAGTIRNLREQVPYLLIPSQYDGNKCVERSIKYVADFVYEDGPTTVVEDSKGLRTRDYILKRKLMLFVHKVAIREV